MMDWKDFWFANKWATNSFLQQKFGIQRHDYENYFRTRPGLKDLRDKFSYSSNKTNSKDLSNIFSNVWSYYWEEESGISPTVCDKDFVEICIKFTQNIIRNSSVSFILDSKYFNRLPGADAWRSSGYTYLSYYFLNYEPTASRLKRLSVIPEMFRDTKLSNISLEDATRFLDHIYIYFYKDLSDSSSERNIIAAKERFFYSFNEPGYFTSADAQAFGFSTTIPFSYTEVKSRLKFTYGVELGFDDSPSLSWNKSKLQNLYPDLDFSKCMLCDAPSPDFHHLLFRSEYPELTYHRENVVPLCSNSHNAITRNKDPIMAAMYRECISKWKVAESGDKVKAFGHLLAQFHDRATGKNTT